MTSTPQPSARYVAPLSISITAMDLIATQRPWRHHGARSSRQGQPALSRLWQTVRAARRAGETDKSETADDATLVDQYEELRRKLVDLQTADALDDVAISEVMGQLDATQLQMKARHGMEGNNPRGHTPIPSPDEG